jgi:dihydrofolate synthase / folylpolyglutamate synthase
MTPRERLFALEQFGIKLGLANIRTLLDALDRPDRAWRAIHVAGTNGKGSVTAMIERGLRAAGHRTGRYTSPHLDEIEERIAINGEPVDAASFDLAARDVLETVDRLHAAGALSAPPTFFEATTALAFEMFRRQNIDVAVVEVGLGGRFDATNTLAPAVTAITSIALDHERHLGTTLSQIAFEKAGIIKPGVPVIVGDMANEAHAVIADVAAAAGARLVDGGAEQVESMRLERGRPMLTIKTPTRTYPTVTLSLNGAHQAANAVVAARTLEVAAEHGLHVRAEDIITALADVEWPARLEWLRTTNGQRILIDAAHNPAGAASLADYVRAAGVDPLPLVIGIMKDKKVEAILGALTPVFSTFVATQADSPRALPASELASHIRRVVPSAKVLLSAAPEQALELALTDSNRVAVAGSIFLVGPLRARLIRRGARAVRDPG